jgi:DDE superfamily endonuclease
VPRDQHYESTYLFGAVCPARGVGTGLVLPHVNVEAMNLQEISRRVTQGAFAVLTLDGAGWHQKGDCLVVPDNIGLLHLPPYSPELNPAENIWEFLRQTTSAIVSTRHTRPWSMPAAMLGTSLWLHPSASDQLQHVNMPKTVGS